MTRRGITFVELLIVVGLTTLLASVCYPVLTRMLRTSLQVRERSGLQTGMRLGLEHMVREVHRSHCVLEATSGTLALFVPAAELLDTPETVVALNRGGGLPFFPMSATSSHVTSGARAVMPGERVRYTLDFNVHTLHRSTEPGRLEGSAVYEESRARTAIASVSFHPSDKTDSRVIAQDIHELLAVPFGYDAEGRLRRAQEPVQAAGVAIRLKGQVTPEGDKPERPVAEELLAKAWVMRRLSETVHPGASSAWDEELDY